MRTSAPDLPVAPAARCRRSTSTTSRTPSPARWKAVLAAVGASADDDDVRGLVHGARDSSPLSRILARLTGRGRRPYKRIHSHPSVPTRLPRGPRESRARDERNPTFGKERTRMKSPARDSQGRGHRRRRRRAAPAPGRPRRRPDHPEARAGGRPGRRHRRLRPPLEHVVQRHPDLVQPLRQPHRAAGPTASSSPGLATEWKLQGQTTWVFKLRQGVKWHNGDPFTLGRRQVQPRADVGSRTRRRA